MKKRIQALRANYLPAFLILLFAICDVQTAHSQQLQPVPGYGFQWNRGRMTTLFGLPTDTFAVTGTLQTYPWLASKANVLYQWNTSTFIWERAGSASITFPYTTKKYLTGYNTFGSLNSDSLIEGATNLFYTTARALLKVNVSDTASMLSNYLNNVGYGLLRTGQTARADSATLASYFLRRKDSSVAGGYYPYSTNPKSYLVAADIAVKLNVSDTANKWVNSITRTPGKDSIIFFIGSTRYAIKDSTGGGSTPDLQAVTDVDNETTNNIYINSSNGQFSIYDGAANAAVTIGVSAIFHSPNDGYINFTNDNNKNTFLSHLSTQASLKLYLPDAVDGDTLATQQWVRAMSVGGAGLVDADYGDITVSGTGTVMTIDNSAVTNAKLASKRKLGIEEVIATDANITAAAGTVYSLPAATLSTNRTIDMTNLNTNGDYIEFDNQEAGFTWTFTGQTVYDAFENAVTVLFANTRYIIRRTNGKLKIIN